jgi:hypothetical protein
MGANALEIYRGDTVSRVVTITENGVAKNLTGYAMYFSARDKNDVEKIAKKSLAITDAVNGKGLLELTSTETDLPFQVYDYDVEIYNSSTGDRKTPIKDTLTPKKDITRT